MEKGYRRKRGARQIPDDEVITLENVTKSYSTGAPALNGVSLHIKRGEFVFIVGDSGSGKSTLLYTVSGMDRMTAGSVSFCGKELSSLSDNAMADVRLDDMGFIFQQMYMMKNLSILDNIILPAVKSRKTKESKSATEKRGRALMKKLGIEETAENDINEVSGGQLQRACICRSMINSPKVIFADEPTGALNRTASDEVMSEMVKLNNEGTTVMLVTHDAKVAAKCSRVLYIVDGNIQGEYKLGNYDNADSLRDREKKLNNWLMEMGW